MYRPYLCQHHKARLAVERAEADVGQVRARPGSGGLKLKGAQAVLKKARARLLSFMPSHLDPHMDFVSYSSIICSLSAEKVFTNKKLRSVVEAFCETKSAAAALNGVVTDSRTSDGKDKQKGRVPKSSIDRHDMLASDDDGYPDPG